MRTKPICFFGLSVLGEVWMALSAPAQIPKALAYSFPAVGAKQAEAALGSSVAVDGEYAVAGAPFDDFGSAGDSGVVRVFDSGTGAPRLTLVNPSGSALEQFGAAVAISGTRVIVGVPFARRGSTIAGRAYVFDLARATPTVPVVTLINPGPDWATNFGLSVAVSGHRAVVWSPKDGDGAGRAGAAYVYDLSATTPWVPVAVLRGPTSSFPDSPPATVAISGDRVVVGDPKDDTGANDSGSAYIFDLGSPTPEVVSFVLRNPSPAPNEAFGSAVAISGSRVAIGAPGDDLAAFAAGVVYVYDLNRAQPASPVWALLPTESRMVAGFGTSVALSGPIVAVGTREVAPGFNQVGGAYAFDLDSVAPTVPVARWTNPTPKDNDGFGYAVAVSGLTVVIGESGDDTAACDAGSASVYNLASEPIERPVVVFHNPGPALDERFGTSVALSGNILAVGGANQFTGWCDPPGHLDGGVEVYFLGGGASKPHLTLARPSHGRSRFGEALALSGTTLVVGASGDFGSSVPSAYVYDLLSPTPNTPILHLLDRGLSSDGFGRAVAISGPRVVVASSSTSSGNHPWTANIYDLRSTTPAAPVFTLFSPAQITPDQAARDGFPSAVAIDGARVVVGASLDDTGAADSGSVYVYDLEGADATTPVLTLRNPTPGANDRFGAAVAIDGLRVVVGAALDDSGASDAGLAYLFDLSLPAPATPRLVLKKPAPVANDQFGGSVAISGSLVLVGAYRDDAGAHNAGSAYVFDVDRVAATVPVATLRNPTPADSDYFGFSVSIDGNYAAVGAPFDDTRTTDKGAAYIFNPSDADEDGLLDAWELTYWPTTAGHGASDDFDSDGLPELLELAFGLNPTVPDAGAGPAIVDGGGFLTVEIAKQPGVTYQVQTASSLEPGRPDSFSPGFTVPIINNAATLKVRDSVLIGSVPLRLMRVVVTAAP